ncbi:MAG: insulinase family protein [Ignavibacteriaceae bacterium]|nr:insulinase family protein [Ignavibacteriaceae bacterium]
MKRFYFIIIMLFVQISVFPQQLKLDDEIPLDKNIITGTLDNGLRYYIRENKKPEDRAFLRLVVNAGSILENDNQQGLAHFVEHIAFDGSKHFQKNDLINYLESIGMRFGADLNAYTSFDETVFKLEVPTDSAVMLEKGFLIMEDWAHNLSFDPAEIDKERGVVIEEWRLGRGADSRMFDKQTPVLLKDSKYAERLPIGKKEIIEYCSYQTLKSFYTTWYRPDLMAVIAVGDFDKNKIEELIKKHFAGIPKVKDEAVRKLFQVPNQDSLLFAIATDPEATNTVVSFYHKMDVEPQDKVKDYRHQLVESLFNRMFNSRLNELSRKANPPFLNAYSSEGNFVRTKDFYTLSAGVKDTGIVLGLETLLSEAQRIKKFGFTQSELDREKIDLMSGMVQAFNEKDKTESESFVDEYIRNFLNGEPSPGIAYEHEIYKQFVPGITLDEVNKLSDQWIQEKNSVVLVNAPQKKGLQIPSEKELRSIFNKVQNSQFKPYDDKFLNVPLIDSIPAPSKIIAEKKNDELNLTELDLANGIKVILKPTNFKNDEISFYAFRSGGTSLADSSLFVSASMSASLVQNSGLGKFDQVELKKLLAGKVVSVGPFIGEISEGLTGSSSVKDLETMFQLIYLSFTSPHIDSVSFISFKSKVQSYLKNRGLSPESAFQDTVQAIFGNYNYRRMPWTLNTISSMDIDSSLNFFKSRFKDASGFTFVFVGNFEVENIKSLVGVYLGGLPSQNKGESFRDLNISPPKGVIDKKVIKGVEPKSYVDITFSGDYDWNIQNNYDFHSMIEVLTIKLREILREDKGATYGVGINGSPLKYPGEKYNINISFGCAPENVADLVKTTFAELDSLKKFKVSDIYINKVKETQKREFEVNTKENKFWLNNLQSYYFYHIDISQLMKYPERVEKFNSEAVQKAAQKYFDNNNYIEVVLYPQKH